MTLEQIHRIEKKYIEMNKQSLLETGKEIKPLDFVCDMADKYYDTWKNLFHALDVCGYMEYIK